MNFWRQVFCVMRQDCRDALRTRRALVVLLLFGVLSVASMYGGIRAIQVFERTAVSVLKLEESGETGRLSKTLWQSKEFTKNVRRETGSPELYEALVGRHPLALLYGALMFMFAPMLAVFLCSAQIPEEVGSGSARFALMRTSRLAWVLGKLCGQLAVMAGAMALGALAAYVMSCYLIPGEMGLELFLSLAEWSARAFVYAAAFAGLTMGVSCGMRSGTKGTAWSLAVFAVWSMVLGALTAYTFFYPDNVLQVAGLFWPGAYKWDLWGSAWQLVRGVVILGCLGLTYFLAGYVVLFSRKDV